LFYRHGFIKKNQTQPVKYFYKGTSKLFSERTIKREIDNYREELGLSENAKRNGFGVIYDCGRLVMEKEVVSP